MAREITIEELEEQASSGWIIDIRPTEQYDKGSFPGAVSIPPERFDLQRIAAQAGMKPVYLLCHTGRLSQEPAEELEAMGCDAYSVAEGYCGYLRLELQRMMADEAERTQRQQKAEQSIIKKFRKQLWTPFTRALKEYQLIQDGDKIAVCISGGKDSMLMAKLFQELLKHGKQNFELVFLVMNPGYNELNARTVAENTRLLGIPVETFHTEIFDIVAN